MRTSCDNGPDIPQSIEDHESRERQLILNELSDGVRNATANIGADSWQTTSSFVSRHIITTCCCQIFCQATVERVPEDTSDPMTSLEDDDILFLNTSS
jgi:hypothetical protein